MTGPDPWRPGVPEHRVVYDVDTIAERVAGLAREVEACYGPEDRLLLLGVLKGSFVFMADFARALDLPVQVDFMTVSSYGDATESSGTVRIEAEPRLPLEGRNVLLVEDIVDSGTTMNRLIPYLEEREPASLEVCALLHKRKTTLAREPRWVGFDAPREFLVGYGLDYSEDLRHLPYIASI